jgi:hypothetical protein
MHCRTRARMCQAVEKNRKALLSCSGLSMLFHEDAAVRHMVYMHFHPDTLLS